MTDAVKGEMFLYHSQNRYEADADCSSKGGQGQSSRLVCSKASMEYLPNAPLLSSSSRETIEKDSGNALN